VEKIRAYLVSRAAAGDPDNLLSATVVYSKLAKEVPEAGFKGPWYTGIGHALDQINRFEHQHGRPMLPPWWCASPTWGQETGSTCAPATSATTCR
jgi:hypothetical protein